MAVDFCDYFWGEEHNGWNVLYHNMKQGLSASKELSEFFKEKVSIDEVYCKSLLKLTNKVNVGSEKGTLGPLLTLLKVSLEKVSNIHLHMVNKVQELVKDVHKYNEDLHKKQKNVKDEESGTEEVVRCIQATRVLVQKAKESYHQRCQDQERMKREGASLKEIEKTEVKLRKAHDEYRSLVDKYNSVRDDFESKLIQSCQRFQVTEESHLSQVMLFVQTYIEILEADKNAKSHVLHELTAKYSHLTIDKLLDNFVLTKLTGLEKPISLVFEDTTSLGSISEQQSPESGTEGLKGANSVSTDDFTEKPPATGVLGAAFLRSRRDKRKEKKQRRRKDDASVAKEDKSDNETYDENRTSELITVGDAKSTSNELQDFENDPDSGVPKKVAEKEAPCEYGANILMDITNSEEGLIDADGYTIRLAQKEPDKRDLSYESSSDSDSDGEIDRRIHVEIKPLSNGSAPISASLDELRATIQSISLSPFANQSLRKNPSDGRENGSCNNSTSQMRSSSADLFGLNFNVHSGGEGGSDSLRPKDRDSADSNLHSANADSMETADYLAHSRSSHSPLSAIAIPRPSRKFETCRNFHSPVSMGVARAESTTSLDFRASGAQCGVSRGPSPLTLGMSDVIPLAVAFQELCHAYFRGTDENRVQIKITGEMMVSFPAGIVGVLTGNPSPAKLSFKILNLENAANIIPNKQLVTRDADACTSIISVYNFNMESLSALLQKQFDQNPSASYFNVDIIKYQVKCNNAVESCPLHLVCYWRCEEQHTDLKIDFKYNGDAMPLNRSPLLNVSFSVPVDGLVTDMHSKPAAKWIKEEQKAVWCLTEVSDHSSNEGKGSLRAKFEVDAGPSTPATVTAHFVCEGSTLSGLDFNLLGSGYRVSLVKKRFVAGKYICDGDAVLRHRYSTVQS